MNEMIEHNYKIFLQDIIANIEHARVNVAKRINSVLNEVNFNIGRMIVERQQEFGWGQSVINQLSKDLNNKLAL